MSKLDFEHHQPRNLTKGKKHSRGFSEDIDEQRRNRVSFKSYLRQVKEEELEQADEVLSTEGAALTDADKKLILEEFREWADGAEPFDCADGELQTYAYDVAPEGLDAQEILSFLRSYAGE